MSNFTRIDLLNTYPPMSHPLLQALVNDSGVAYPLSIEAAKQWCQGRSNNTQIVVSNIGGRRVLALLDYSVVVAYVDMTMPGCSSVQVESPACLAEFLDSLYQVQQRLNRKKLATNSSSLELDGWEAHPFLPELTTKLGETPWLNFYADGDRESISRLLIDSHRISLFRVDPSKEAPVAQVNSIISINSSPTMIVVQMEDGAEETLHARQLFSLSCHVNELNPGTDALQVFNALAKGGAFFQLLDVSKLLSHGEQHVRLNFRQFDPERSMNPFMVTVYVKTSHSPEHWQERLGVRERGLLSLAHPCLKALKPTLLLCERYPDFADPSQ